MEHQGIDGLHLRSIFCITIHDTEKKVYGSLLFISGILGILGSFLQMFVWQRYLKKHDLRHKPSSNPHVVFNLALSNAVSCFMSIVLALAMLFVHRPLQMSKISQSISSQDIYWIFPVQILCDLGYIASALWTLMYLVDVCLQVHKINCRILVYYSLAWGLAIFLTVIAQVLRLTGQDSIRRCISARDIPCIVIVWISLVIVLLALSSIVLFAIDRQVKSDICLASNAYTANQRTLMQHVRAKFVFFFATFVTCWVSTLIGNILVLANYGPTVQEALCFTEAILHPLQGLFNYFIFTPLRAGQNPVTYQGGRKSPLLPRGTIQQIYGTSYESSFASSIVPTSQLPSVSSFHFTPCFPKDGSPLMTSFQSSDSIDNYSCDETLKIGDLLGENNYNF
ncbi:G-protein coupled receptor 143-like [Rhopilema esculentum]|uniref:G-protein coupled receptor 143-like n=1 Tax=Rhopilema esculentum TaxID=499914 RepID=UPI0031D2595D